MKFAYYPPRQSNPDLTTNTFLQLFAESFSASGWHLHHKGFGTQYDPNDSLLSIEYWMEHHIDLGIFHWGWDRREDFPQLVELLKSTSKKILWVCHELAYNEEAQENKALLLSNRALMAQEADYIAVLNEGDYFNLKGKRGGVYLIKHMMPYTFVAPYPEAYFNSDASRYFTDPVFYEEKTFCFYGLVKENKGIVRLLQAWNKMSPQYPDWKLKLYAKEIVGWNTEVVKEVEANLGERTVWIRMGYTSIPHLLGEFAILPYLKANNSGVLHELVAFGCPVLTSDCKAFEDYSLLRNDDIAYLIQYGINNASNLRSQADTMRLRLFEQNYEAKVATMDLALRILKDLF